jgi:tetratricopeptide (TPR) repeat protein
VKKMRQPTHLSSHKRYARNIASESPLFSALFIRFRRPKSAMNTIYRASTSVGVALALGGGLSLALLNKPMQASSTAEAKQVATLTTNENAQILQTQPQTAEDYYNQGLVLQGEGNIEQAIASFSRAVELDPTADHYFARGLAYSDQGAQKLAIADYTQAIQLDSNFAAALYQRGMAHYALKDNAAAVADFTQALNVDQSFVAAYYSRGLAYYDLGNEKLARQDYNKARQLSPTMTAAYYDQGVARPQIGGE